MLILYPLPQAERQASELAAGSSLPCGRESEFNILALALRKVSHDFHPFRPCRTLRFKRKRRLPPPGKRLAKHSGDGIGTIVGTGLECGDGRRAKCLKYASARHGIVPGQEAIKESKPFRERACVSRLSEACVWIIGSSSDLTRGSRHKHQGAVNFTVTPRCRK
jgi:hypothetical protein